MPTIACAWTALDGVRYVGWIAAKTRGSRPPRPRAKVARVAAVAPELALARQLFKMAKVTIRLPIPGSTWSAMPPHGLPLLALIKPVILSGPKNTVAA